MAAGLGTLPRVAIRPRAVPGSAGYAGLLLLYAIALPILLLLGPAVLTGQIGVMPGFTWQEAADLVTPIVILPLFALALFRGGGTQVRTFVAFTIVAAVWVSGQAMHLAANAMGDASVEFGVTGYLASVPGALGDWMDEVLSHWLWHVAWVALLILLAVATWRSTAADEPSPDRSRAALVAGALQGFTWFWVTVEGVTAALGIPAAILYLGFGLLRRRADGNAGVSASFLLATGTVSIIGYAIWAAINGGSLPEFSHWAAPW